MNDAVHAHYDWMISKINLDQKVKSNDLIPTIQIMNWTTPIAFSYSTIYSISWLTFLSIRGSYDKDQRISFHHP